LNYRTTADLARLVNANIHRVPADVDVVVGVPRSGMIPAGLIALAMNRPLADLDGFCEGRFLGAGSTRRGSLGTRLDPSQARVALIVDDSVASGGSIRRARERLLAAGLPHRFVFCAPFVTRDTRDAVDIHFEVVGMPRMFEWNFMHHPALAECCVDFDGVLCRDPSEAENDDGERYRRFLLTADRRYAATCRIGAIVTSRLEKWRPETETWLREHGVDYDELVMLDLPDARTRRRLGVHASFKADAFRARPARLFIESERGQAIEIARRSGKHALCVDTQELFAPDVASLAGAHEQGRFLLQRIRGRLGRTWRRATGAWGHASP
jgi:uncharacterized HAD superfamily protein